MKEMVYSNKPKMEVLASGAYKGFDYAIISYGTHPCAYVKLPNGHEYYGKHYEKIPVDCHGGLTYSYDILHALPGDNDGWWIGWDYSHCGDYSGFMEEISEWKKWTTAEIFEEVKEVIGQLAD